MGTGIYFVDDGSTQLGTSYIFYINEERKEFISTENNQGSINVTEFNMDDDEIITHLKITFNNIEVAHNDEILCINNFSLTFNLLVEE